MAAANTLMVNVGGGDEFAAPTVVESWVTRRLLLYLFPSLDGWVGFAVIHKAAANAP